MGLHRCGSQVGGAQSAVLWGTLVSAVHRVNLPGSCTCATLVGLLDLWQVCLCTGRVQETTLVESGAGMYMCVP